LGDGKNFTSVVTFLYTVVASITGHGVAVVTLLAGVEAPVTADWGTFDREITVTCGVIA
jgi:hypothetical protein